MKNNIAIHLHNMRPKGLNVIEIDEYIREGMANLVIQDLRKHIRI